MFYSHEILTSRKGGVATVWLVATLGSKSSLKKVNRRAILDVDVPETCRIIITPEAPMALRLQSNLLYGVSRVFYQQCGYVLSDAQVAQANMRTLIKAVKTSGLDPNAGKARPDQLVLQDDPAFVPDFSLPGFDMNLSALDLWIDDSSQGSTILSPHLQRSSQSSRQAADESMLGLLIPTSDTGGAGDIGGFILPSEQVSSAQRDPQFGQFLNDDDEGFNLDPGFSIDADGNLIEEPILETRGPLVEGVRLGSDSAASGRVRQDQVESLQTGQYVPEQRGLGINVPRFEDDGIILPPAVPFPSMVVPGGDVRAPASGVLQERKSSESAEAPLSRKPRSPRQLPVDKRQELHNAELAQWKAGYIDNMAGAVEAKKHHRASALAKKNAAFWVIGSGIAGVGAGLGASKFKSPLDMFAGNAMMEALTGIKLTRAGLKRGREDEGEYDSDSEERRVRMRDGDGSQIGRGDEMMLQDDEGITMVSAGEGIELGRHAQPPLEDPSFPWNVSSAHGSRQGSIARGHGFGSSVGGFPTSTGRPSSMPGMGGAGPGSFERRASRIPSASPLLGRGQQRYSSLELPIPDDDEDLLGGRRQSDEQALEELEPYGPGAAVDTQTAADSQKVRSALDQEANNFLGFVEAKIATIPAPEDDEEDELSGPHESKTSITFEELLPPGQNTKIVAAQGFYHVLALATKGLLNVKQDLPADGAIDLSFPALL